MKTKKPKLDSLKKLRDKGLAHNDKEFAKDPKAFVSSFFVTLSELEVLINTAAEICNRILGEYSDKTRALDPYFPASANNIIEDIALAKKYRENNQLWR